MLALSTTDWLQAFRQFKHHGINVTFVVPTETGLGKSIMDATGQLRTYFRTSGAHDFASQEQGEAHKRKIKTTLLCDRKVFETETSLYRPETKSGDPRIWIYGLKNYADAGDLIALSYADNQLIAINCTQTDLDALLGNPSVQIKILQQTTESSATVDELLVKLKSIADKGYVRTLRSGDTGVGYTLETMLGIKANSSKKPDYKGIELKAGRDRTAKGGQSTIFSKVPNWKISRLKGSRQILEERGKYNVEKQRNQLFHEISAVSANSYGLQLALDAELLHQVYVESPNDQAIRDVTWELATLENELQKKHAETMWITAQTRGKGAQEEFWYTSAKYATGVDVAAWALMIESGAVTVHYLIRETATGGAKDQGYLFKTSPKNIEMLFKSVREFPLIC